MGSNARGGSGVDAADAVKDPAGRTAIALPGLPRRDRPAAAAWAFAGPGRGRGSLPGRRLFPLPTMLWSSPSERRRKVVRLGWAVDAEPVEEDCDSRMLFDSAWNRVTLLRLTLQLAA